MTTWLRSSRPVGVLTLASLIGLASAGAAQTSPGGVAGSSTPAIAWAVAAGDETIGLRDVAGTTPRADASPVSWEGHGPAVTARCDLANARRLHRFDLAVSSAGHFAYDALVQAMPRSRDDRATRIGGRYEYRRYPFRDLWMDGLDLGIGVQGIGEHVSLTRHFDPSIETHRAVNRLGTAVVAAVRLHRWPRLHVEVAWANGMLIDRTGATHSVGAQADYKQWGGGWLTDLAISATVPIARGVGLEAAYLHNAQGHYASHDQYVSERRRLLVGVVYGQ